VAALVLFVAAAPAAAVTIHVDRVDDGPTAPVALHSERAVSPSRIQTA
jgi:hypothetical protein